MQGSIWSRYKKPIIITAVSLMAFFTLVIGGVGYAVYQSVVFAKDSLQKVEGEVPGQGFVEGFVISVGSLWLQQNLAEQDAAQLKDGLSCIDAMGGPSPLEMVNLVKTKVNDERIAKELETLTESLQTAESKSPGPAACASLILNG